VIHRMISVLLFLTILNTYYLLPSILCDKPSRITSPHLTVLYKPTTYSQPIYPLCNYSKTVQNSQSNNQSLPCVNKRVVLILSSWIYSIVCSLHVVFKSIVSTVLDTRYSVTSNYRHTLTSCRLSDLPTFRSEV
jgi:hypothetical protein